MAHVTVLGTGGTIASTSKDTGATPELSGADLVEAVPDLESYATLSVEQVAQVPSFDMDFSTVARVGEAAERAVDGGADGVVVTHGTDTMEESAYLLDSTLDVDAPVVFTGAQRRPDQVSPDGPSNLLTAVRAAVHDRLSGAGGVYIAFNEKLHAARDVTKTHTSALETFASPNTGPVASFHPGDVRFYREPGRRCVRVPVREPTARVEVVTTGVGVDAAAIDRALAAGVDGLVLEGTGLGNTTSALGDAVGRAVETGVPVVVTSRCGAGAVAPVYGTPGGGATLADHGALFGGDLPPQKARLTLALALTAADTVEDVEPYFAL
ncbi:asparaginase [Salinigranum halophilum]|uniref:asparaginase n=1 Tax=Salinigranum halophilum TaxID=2565931 RepID=UPI0010A82069|nr:asparaginase [Salinigranum halophilum]